MRSKLGKFHRRIYLLSLVLLLAMQTWAQAPRRVNLQAQKQSLIEVLQQIKQETGVRFIYSDNELNNASPVTIRLKDTPLEDALKQIFKNQPYVVETMRKIYIPSFLSLPPLLPNKERKSSEVKWLTEKTVKHSSEQPSWKTSIRPEPSVPLTEPS